MNHSAVRKADDSRDEPVLCPNITGNSAKKQLQIVSLGLCYWQSVTTQFVPISLVGSTKTMS